jgi:hypothetical protein
MTRYSTSRPVQSCAASAAPVRGLLGQRAVLTCRVCKQTVSRAPRDRRHACGVADSTDVNCPRLLCGHFSAAVWSLSALQRRRVAVGAAVGARRGTSAPRGPPTSLLSF